MPAGIRARRKCGALHLVAAKTYSREEIWQSVARLGYGLKRERRSGAHIKQKRGKAQTGLSVLPEERRIKRRAMSLGEGHSKGNQRVFGKGIIRNYGGLQFQRRIRRLRGAKVGTHSAKKMPKLRFRKFSNTRWREGRADKAQEGARVCLKREDGKRSCSAS